MTDITKLRQRAASDAEWIQAMTNAGVKMQMELDAAQADAGRYRFLRDQCDISWEPAKSANKLPAAMVDAAIDAAIKALDVTVR